MLDRRRASIPTAQHTTHSEQFLNLNIMECSLKDLDFNGQFRLHVRDDRWNRDPEAGRMMDGFLIHFYFEFSHCHTKPGVSSG